MDNNISDYLEYVKKVAEIINEKGIPAQIMKIDKAGAEEYGLRITEDPNSIYKATIKLDTPEKIARKKGDEEAYANDIVKQMLEHESPVRTAEAELLKKRYEDIKEFVFPRFMDPEKYKTYLKKVPNRNHLDYAVAYCYIRDGRSLTVTNEILERSGITEQQIYQDSIRNIKPRGPISIKKLMADEALNAIGSKIQGYDRDKDNPLFVITNKDMLGGINVLLLPDFLKEIATELGGDYHIITCSTDFAVVAAEKEKWLETEKMMAFVEKVASIISGIDNHLTNRSYRYNSRTESIEDVEK